MIILSRVLFLNWVIVGMPLTKENVSRFPSLSIVLFAYLYDELLLQQEMEKQQHVHIVNQTHTSLATVTIAQCADTYFCQGKEIT